MNSDQLAIQVAHARTSDPWTSHEAADSVTKIRATQSAILAVFEQYGPMTDTTLIEHYSTFAPTMHQSESGLRTRRKELVDMGKLQDTGRTEILPSGRKSIVWGIPNGV